MSKPTINYLAETCAGIVAQGADARFVSDMLDEAIPDGNNLVGQHFALYCCVRTVVTNIKDNVARDKFFRLVAQKGFTCVSIEQVHKLKELYPYHWFLVFNEDGSGSISDPKVDFHKEFEHLSEIL